MDCIKVSQNLHHYLDGEVGRFRRQQISRHLHSCPACSGGFRFESQFRQIIPAKCHDEVPPELVGRILDALARPPMQASDFGAEASGPLE